MQKIMLFEDFLNEAKELQDLHKIYLAIDPKSGHRWWSFKGFAGDNFFIQVTLDNYKKLDINPDYPVLTYNSKVVQTLLDEGLIRLENVYNKPEFIKQSGSKKEFHELVEGDENIPKTCYDSKKAINEVGFPMIAKPAEGHSGLGISVLKTQKDFDACDHSKLDVYSQYIDKKSEHRFFTFKGKPFFWMQRTPQNAKAKTGDGDSAEKMSFAYTRMDASKTPQKYIDLISKFGNLMENLPYICFDIMEDQKGHLYVIESNSQPGVPFDSTVQIYRTLFEDFYGREVNQNTDKKLSDLSDYLNKKTLEIDKKRFNISN